MEQKKLLDMEASLSNQVLRTYVTEDSVYQAKTNKIDKAKIAKSVLKTGNSRSPIRKARPRRTLRDELEVT
jgi:hypothetical protein